MFFNFKRRTEARLSARRAVAFLISQYGDRAYRAAGARALDSRTSRIIDSDRDQRHWEHVHTRIARRRRLSKINTATRMLDEPYMSDDEFLSLTVSKMLARGFNHVKATCGNCGRSWDAPIPIIADGARPQDSSY